MRKLLVPLDENNNKNIVWYLCARECRIKQSMSNKFWIWQIEIVCTMSEKKYIASSLRDLKRSVIHEKLRSIGTSGLDCKKKNEFVAIRSSRKALTVHWSRNKNQSYDLSHFSNSPLCKDCLTRLGYFENIKNEKTTKKREENEWKCARAHAFVRDT